MPLKVSMTPKYEYCIIIMISIIFWVIFLWYLYQVEVVKCKCVQGWQKHVEGEYGVYGGEREKVVYLDNNEK